MSKFTYLSGSYLTPNTLNAYLGTSAATGHLHTGLNDVSSAPKIDLTAHVTGKLPFLNAVAPNGYISGLEMYFPGLLPRAAPIPTDQVCFRAGTCTVQDLSGNKLMVTAPAGSKYLRSGWTGGSSGNGLPGAVSLTNAWYYVYLLVYADGVTCDWGFDSTGPTNVLTASGATYYRRIGSVWWQNGTDFIRQFRQTGNEVRFAQEPLVSTSTLTGGALALITITAPLNLSVQAIMSIYGYGADSGTAIASWLAGDWDANTLLVGQTCDHSTVSFDDPGPMIVYCWTSTAAQIQYATGYGSGATTIEFSTVGYIDPRL